MGLGGGTCLQLVCRQFGRSSLTSQVAFLAAVGFRSLSFPFDRRFVILVFAGESALQLVIWLLPIKVNFLFCVKRGFATPEATQHNIFCSSCRIVPLFPSGLRQF